MVNAPFVLELCILAFTTITTFSSSEAVLWPLPKNCATWVALGDVFEISKFTALFKQGEFSQPVMLQYTTSSLVLSGRNYSADYELTADDLLNTIYSGANKHIPQCQNVFVSPVTDLQKEGVDLENGVIDLKIFVKGAILKKLVRSHRDHFFFSSVLDSAWIDDSIRYKYSIAYNEIIAAPATVNGKHLRFSVVSGVPWIRNLQNGGGRGSQFKLVADASARFNFTFSIDYAKNGGSSGMKRDGQWVGAVGEVFTRQTDISMGAGITVLRNSIVDGGKSLAAVLRIFFAKRLPPETNNWKSIFAAFEPSVWIGLLLAISALTLAQKWILQAYYHDSATCASTTNVSFNETLLPVVAILLEEANSSVKWVNVKMKMLVLLWIGFALVLCAGYKSRLVYFLTFVSPGKVPTTHRALLDDGYKLYFRYYGGVAYRYSLASSDPVQRTIAQNAILINSSQDCIIQVLLNEKAACLDWEPHGSYAVYSNASAQISEVDQIVKSEDVAMSSVPVPWCYRKYSPLKELFDTYFENIFSAGILEQWEWEDVAEVKREGYRWLHSASASSIPQNQKILRILSTDSNSLPKLSIGSFLALLFISAVILVLALVVFVLEKFRNSL